VFEKAIEHLASGVVTLANPDKAALETIQAEDIPDLDAFCGTQYSSAVV